ncbi:phosphopantetheinyl transferase [[Pantoea] beijingensis]|uniref:Phosphopantetheinyl transferase n=1 Tax=[Pantoea] beijingensis TaxID=1324864 RepID=A0A443IH40_9GAMM|nr:MULTISPECIES: phosphopantetheinyl transferase [Erwiniaceae]RWR03368.1 phosphopantetheinyl transferase [[Pantoea] beijingensis]
MASHFVRWTFVQSKPNVHRLPQQLVENSLSFESRRRGRFLASRMLLAELMLRVYGIQRLPEIITLSNGRPAFADPDLPDFSIAYAGGQIGVLLAEEGARGGLDMEIVRAHSRQTLNNYMQVLSSAEKAWVNAQQDCIEAITQLWTLRHSVMKLTGEIDPGDAVRLHPASGRLRSSTMPDIQAICDVEPLLIWSCALSPASDRLHLWEFDDRYNWHSLGDIEINKPRMGPRALRLTSMPSERLLQH